MSKGKLKKKMKNIEEKISKVRDMKDVLSFQLVLADCSNLRNRLCALHLDAAKDPLDRFNMHGPFIELPECKHDYLDEYYLMIQGGVDIGFTKINKDLQPRCALISFYLIKSHRNQGILTEAVPFVGKRVFHELGFNKVRACAWETNGVAISIYEKWLKPEGVLRAHGYFEGNYVDFFQYGCLYSESDFQRKKK